MCESEVRYTFTAQLWLWDARKSDSWTFVTAPSEVSEELHERSGPRRGFGSIPVEVSVGATTWRTSVFPDKASGCFVLPIKAAVRAAEGIAPGDDVEVCLRQR